ncbi:hypothetical protein ACRJ4W_03845 [Streptomyces sp. GLT-R25]
MGGWGIAPEGDVREQDQCKKGPDVPGGGFGRHHAHFGMEQSGEPEVEFGVARAVRVVGEAGTLGEIDNSRAKFAELRGGNPVATRGHVHRRLV